MEMLGYMTGTELLKLKPEHFTDTGDINKQGILFLFNLRGDRILELENKIREISEAKDGIVRPV